MQFTIIAVLVAAAMTVTASPATVAAMEKRGCHVLGCLEALAPAIVSCGIALAEEGENPFEDIICFKDAAKDITHPPSACKGCL
ncbi:hypothetical protein BD410DRAFT_845251 [Rickenella mellea]|uniref:Fungal calcium binding protein domain-containing protein n=1 Tax=Rickenella mellea TaxID=50990 RepID=A0A4Y7PK30_9AGAM|nr:hypothetical protein BD410DRAFT_845251 [Rickenella mellea]